MPDSTALPLPEVRQVLGEGFGAFTGPLLERLAADLDRRLVRSVEQALHAILVHPRPDQALMLTTFAEQGPHRPRLLHTVKRFFRLVHHPNLSAQTLRDWLLERGTREWSPAGDHLVLVDGSEVVKPYAERMEHLCRVRNPLEKTGGPKTVPGYWLLLAVRTTLGKGMAQVLDWQVWSTLAPDFRSQNLIEERFLERLSARVGRRAVLVMDRGLGRFALLGKLANWRARFVARLSIGRDFAVDEAGMVHLRLLAYALPLPFERIVRDPGDRRDKVARFGFRTVRRPEIPGALTLVVQWLEGLEEPWLLLTNEPVRTEAQAWRIVEIYWRRMAIEETLRYLKGEVGLQSFRVRAFAAIERLVAFAMVVYAFLIELLETGGPLVGALCRLTRWLGLKTEHTTAYKLKWALSRLLAYQAPDYG